jgi:hypothetical protein
MHHFMHVCMDLLFASVAIYFSLKYDFLFLNTIRWGLCMSLVLAISMCVVMYCRSIYWWKVWLSWESQSKKKQVGKAFLSVSLSTCLSLYLSVYLSVCLAGWLSGCPISVWLTSVCLAVQCSSGCPVSVCLVCVLYQCSLFRSWIVAKSCQAVGAFLQQHFTSPSSHFLSNWGSLHLNLCVYLWSWYLYSQTLNCSVRSLTLISFRDIVVLKTKLEGE